MSYVEAFEQFVAWLGDVLIFWANHPDVLFWLGLLGVVLLLLLVPWNKNKPK